MKSWRRVFVVAAQGEGSKMPTPASADHHPSSGHSLLGWDRQAPMPKRHSCWRWEREPQRPGNWPVPQACLHILTPSTKPRLTLGHPGHSRIHPSTWDTSLLSRDENYTLCWPWLWLNRAQEPTEHRGWKLVPASTTWTSSANLRESERV